MRREWYGSGTAEGEKGGRRPCDEEVGGLVNRPREGCGEGGGWGGGGGMRRRPMREGWGRSPESRVREFLWESLPSDRSL